MEYDFTALLPLIKNLETFNKTPYSDTFGYKCLTIIKDKLHDHFGLHGDLANEIYIDHINIEQIVLHTTLKVDIPTEAFNHTIVQDLLDAYTICLGRSFDAYRKLCPSIAAKEIIKQVCSEFSLDLTV
jgi:hypothetical protein